MKVNSTLEKKLLKYSALTAGAVAISASSNAQLSYTDINPDSVAVLNGTGAAIDFDNDGTDDVAVGKQVGTFNGSTGSSTSPGVSYNVFYNVGVVVTTPGNAVMTVSSGDVGALALNTAIGASGAFAGMDSGGLLGYNAFYSFPAYPGYSGTTAAGPWLGAADLYLGVRFMIGANTHYGWVRMDFTADATTLTVKDYAYNTVPNATINAGVTGVGINEFSENLAIMNFFNNQLNINVVDGTNGMLSIISLDGKAVYTGSLLNENETIDLSNLTTGIYVVNAEFAEGSVQQKIVVR